MIAFRDRLAAEPGLEVRVHTNEAGRRAGVHPFDHGSEPYTDVMTLPVPGEVRVCS